MCVNCNGKIHKKILSALSLQTFEEMLSFVRLLMLRLLYSEVQTLNSKHAKHNMSTSFVLSFSVEYCKYRHFGHGLQIYIGINFQII